MELFSCRESYTAGGIIHVYCLVIYQRTKKSRIKQHHYIVSLRAGDFVCTRTGASEGQLPRKSVLSGVSYADAQPLVLLKGQLARVMHPAAPVGFGEVN